MSDGVHVIEFGPAGWTLQHPLSCRPNLFECPVNRLAEELPERPVEPGRYVVELHPDGDRLCVQRRATDEDLEPAQQTGLLYEDVRGQLLAEVRAERDAQIGQWGEQRMPDGTSRALARFAVTARVRCARAAAAGKATWRHVLDEEVAEAFAEEDQAVLRGELLQVAAVALAWIEDIDSRPAPADRQTTTG